VPKTEEAIKGKPLEIIDQEDKINLQSDEDLVAKLKEAGCPVDGRTVTHYRKTSTSPRQVSVRTGCNHEW
jgi:DNA-directed RNA polymerase specialized sigma54-like protein